LTFVSARIRLLADGDVERLVVLVAHVREPGPDLLPP
jgi:hypothetical protein